MSDNSSIDRRLARIEGQIGGLRRMIQQGEYCVDVLTQIAAVRSALNQVSAQIATGHVRGCIVGHAAGEGHEDAKRMSEDDLLQELELTLTRLMK